MVQRVVNGKIYDTKASELILGAAWEYPSDGLDRKVKRLTPRRIKRISDPGVLEEPRALFRDNEGDFFIVVGYWEILQDSNGVPYRTDVWSVDFNLVAPKEACQFLINDDADDIAIKLFANGDYERYRGQQEKQVIVRMPLSLKESLSNAAKYSKQSVNQFVLKAIQSALQSPTENPVDLSEEKYSGALANKLALTGKEFKTAVHEIVEEILGKSNQ